jgi:hypothetical protein
MRNLARVRIHPTADDGWAVQKSDVADAPHRGTNEIVGTHGHLRGMIDADALANARFVPS